MRRSHVCLLALSPGLLVNGVPNPPAAGGTCFDPDPATAPVEAYACPLGFSPKVPANTAGACTDIASCNLNCCTPSDAPAAGGKCEDPDPSKGAAAPFACRTDLGWTDKAGVEKLECTTAEECTKNCCEPPPIGTVTATIFTTTTITPFDISSGSSGNSLASEASSSGSLWKHEGSSGRSSGVDASGSSGFDLPLWLWSLLLALACCLCALAGFLCTKPKRKKPASKTARPRHEPEPHHEHEPLLPPLVPLQTTSIVPPPTTSALPGYSVVNAPVMQPAVSTPIPSYGYAGYPGQGYTGQGYPGQVV